ncbi:metal ABC transporter solute-binding protein, Zn/Mn family [Virgibacillus sp. CBA3643]|uniref:metal ABC transporter solute-binding protein, Zn/Mn family n=1 Tax=Virgibacillus sp. CBA3643 TaxID=2942278 RepID=UPI0035A3AF06
MKSMIKVMVMFLGTIFVLTACGGDSAENNANENIQIVTSFTILEDIIKEVGGDQVDVYNLVPTGTDPHDYEPLPDDIKKATDADALVYNGLNLEGGENGWFYKMIDTVDQEENHIFQLADGVDPMYLTPEDEREEAINPHAFVDPEVGILMTENARDALIEVDPDHEAEYKQNAEDYLYKLNAIDKEYEEKINDIPEDNRMLVTSERAFQYMTDHYGLEEGYIWAIDTEENGTPEQITSLVNFVEENDVPALFVESNVDTRPMETVSDETGVEIAGELYSDEIGEPGEEAATYLSYLEYNINKIHDVLAE